DATDLFIPADDRIQLAAPRGIGEIASVLLEGLVLRLGRLVRDAMGAADRLESLEECFLVDARAFQQVPALGSLGLREREQQVLGRHELVAQRLGFLLGAIEDAVQLPREGRLRVRLARIAARLGGDAVAQGLDADAELVQQRRDDAFVLVEEGAQQMGVVDQRVPITASIVDGRVDGLRALDREFVCVDHASVNRNQRTVGKPRNWHISARVACRAGLGFIIATASLACAHQPTGSDVSDSTFVRSMTGLRLVAADTSLDSAASRLATHPEHAVELLRAIDQNVTRANNKSVAPRARTVPATPAPSPPATPAAPATKTPGKKSL